VIIEDQRRSGLKSAYGGGRGKIRVRAKAIVEEMSRGRHRIVITEIPYMTKKVTVLERIAKLVRDEEIEGIADLRDESDRQGMRIVIELMKSAQPEEVLETLFKRSTLENTFSIIILALVDGEPKLLNLKGALLVYLEHRLEIIKRRSKFELDNAKAREHVLAGLTTALDNLDAVIETIRKSRSAQTAKNNLMRDFSLTDIQAQAILDMPLRRLAGLERKKIEDEYKQIQKKIKELSALLKSPKKMREVVSVSLQEIKERFGDARRTQIAMVEGGLDAAPMKLAQLTPSESIWVMINRDGLISRTPGNDLPRPSGWDVPNWLVKTNTRDTLYLVSENGEAAAIPAHTVPEASKPSQGTHFSTLCPFQKGTELGAVFGLPPKEDREENWYVLSITEQSMLKKTEINELPGPSAQPFTLVKVNKGDKLVSLRLSDGSKDIFLATSRGMAIRFSEEDVRSMGLVAAGVNGMKLDKDDRIIGMETLPRKGEIFFLTATGRAKRITPEDFPVQGRYGKGVIAWKLPDEDSLVGMTAGKGTMRVTVHLDKFAPKSARLDEAPLQSRVAQKGKEVVEIKDDDRVSLMTIPWEVFRPVVKE
jgi:DNA gyrase subunit A